MSGDYDFSGAIPFLIGALAVGGLVVGGIGWGASSYFNKAADPLVSVSAGREQLMKEGFVGTQEQFRTFLSRQVDEYFKMNGYPCDPKDASGTLAQTVARAKCSPSAP